MNKLFALLAFVLLSTPAIARDPLPNFVPAKLDVVCGPQAELEKYFVEEIKGQPVMSGLTLNPTLSQAPVKMMMNKEGVYILYAVNNTSKEVCVLDSGQMHLKERTES